MSLFLNGNSANNNNNGVIMTNKTIIGKILVTTLALGVIGWWFYQVGFVSAMINLLVIVSIFLVMFNIMDQVYYDRMNEEATAAYKALAAKWKSEEPVENKES